MKNRIFFVAFLALLMSGVPFAQPPGNGWGTPVFSDEFNGSSLNTGQWSYNQSTSEFAIDHVVVANNRLSINNTYTTGSVATGGWIQSKTAGIVGDNKYGYFEARLRINAPAHGQIWPTWWIWGGNWRNGGPAPSTTEFDIMEYSGWAAKFSENHATTSHHYKAKKIIDGVKHVTTSTASNKTRDAFDWHTWGLLWTPTEVSFWYDGVKYFTSPQAADAATEDIDMRLIFSCSPHIGSNPIEANKPIPGEILPSFEVDWVRVWRGGDPQALVAKGNSGWFDMGLVGSTAAQNYNLVTEQTIGKEYGWLGLFDLKSSDRGDTETDLQRDFVAGIEPTTFEYATSNATYEVTVTIGDLTTARDSIRIKAEGEIVKDSINRTAGEISEEKFQVEVRDGKLTLEFSDEGGSDDSWIVNAIKIDSIGPLGGVNVKEVSGIKKISVFPNPVTNDILTLELELITNSALKINIFDFSGRLIGQKTLGYFSIGEQVIHLNPQELGLNNSGMYFMELRAGNYSDRVKLIME